MLDTYLIDHNKWMEFLEYKINKEFISSKEKEELKSFIDNKKYLEISTSIINNKYTFSIPNKHVISKNSSNKKRIVYSFNNDEMIILKYISYLLYDYDYLFDNNLYSFRKSIGVKTAINNITNIKNISNMYGYKVDIKNYFNSINTKILLNNLKNNIKDTKLFNLINSIISNDKVMYKNEIIIEDKGVMAGIPISAFLANYYLKEIDNYFWNQKLVYFRYADDIIIFTNSISDLNHHRSVLLDYLNKYDLVINSSKEHYYNPHDEWEFLGFSFHNHRIDISHNSIVKIKGKIKRSAKGIRRWMIKKDANYKSTLKAMNRKFNKKFYGNESSELSWKYWFFPIINTTSSLKIVDKYMQDELRFIVTGKHNKKNFEKVPYSLLKECNYRSLVNEYYK